MGDRSDKLFDVLLEEVVNKYAEDIADGEIPCNMTDEETKIMEEQKQRIYNNVKKQIRRQETSHRRIGFKKGLAIAAAVVLLASAALNASALRIFVYKTYMDIKGTTLSVKSGTITDEDYNVITEFKNRDEIVVPGWLPPELSIEEIDEDENSISIDYYTDDKEKFIFLSEHTLPYDPDGGMETENNTYWIKDYEIMDMPGKLVYIKYEDGYENYAAFWCTDNTTYEIDTNYPRTTFDAILSELKYLK